MLNDQERQYIYRHAYLPEHLPDYVGAVSGAEPFLHHNYLYFLGNKHLIFNGYALGPNSDPPARIYDLICNRCRPTTLAVIASAIWLPAEQYEQEAIDSYFRLDLPLAPIDANSRLHAKTRPQRSSGDTRQFRQRAPEDNQSICV